MKPLNILYVCTHNRCRSILSEAVTNKIAGSYMAARSAGSSPAEAVHPLTLSCLEYRGYEASGLRSKSWLDLQGFQPDLVVTVCDSAAKEVCPLWSGNCHRLHWSLPDPSKLTGDKATIQNAFYLLINALEVRASSMLEVCRCAASKTTAINELEKLGQIRVTF